MTPRTRLKVGFALAGLILYGVGIRYESSLFRWEGIACVAVAALLRFWKEPSRPA